jgi:hypothetical protein
MSSTTPATIMTRVRRTIRFLLGTIKTVLAFCLFGLLLAVLYLGTIGFPSWLVRKITAPLSDESIALHAGVVKLAPPCGLSMKDVQLMPRRRLGPAMLEARRLDVAMDLAALRRGLFRVRSVCVYDAVLRPEMFGTGGKSVEKPRPIRMPSQHWRIRNGRVFGIVLDDAEADVEWEGLYVHARNAHGIARAGSMSGRFAGDMETDRGSGRMSGHVATTCDPRVLLPVMQALKLSFAEELTRRFDFGPTVPRTELWFDRSGGELSRLRVGGTFTVKDSSYQGVSFANAAGGLDMEFSQTNCVVKVQPLRIERREGVAEGGFVVRSADALGEVEFDAISSLHPEALLRMIGLVGREEILPFRFEGPFRMSARGVADYQDMTNTLFHGTASCGGIGVEGAMIRDCSFHMTMEGRTNYCTDIRGTLFGGSLVGSVNVVTPVAPATDIVYSATGRLARADFERCVNEWTGTTTNQYSGIMSCAFDVRGVANDPGFKRLAGRADVHIKDGRVFMLPVFGGLSRYLARIIPGLDVVMRQTAAQTAFTIGDGKASTEKVMIEGDVLSLGGQGSFAFNGALDFDVQIHLMKEHTLVAKLLRVITWPISKLLEFRLRGTLDEPRWYLVHFSSDLLEKIGLSSSDAVERDAGPVRSREE